MDESWYYLGALSAMAICALAGWPRDWSRPVAAALSIEIAWYWWLQAIYVYGAVEHPAVSISAACLTFAYGWHALRFRDWPYAWLSAVLVIGAAAVIPLTLAYQSAMRLDEVYEYKFWRNGAAIFRYAAILSWAVLLWTDGHTTKSARSNK